jgi:hypothetical protein
MGLYDYGPRFYDPYLNRFLSPDTVIPDPYSPSDWDRYAYVRNNSIKYNDPTGHWPEPPPTPNPIDFIQQAFQFITNLGYSVVGNPMAKSIYSNGADIVAQKFNEAGQVIETLCIECKQVSGSVNLGTLGKDKLGNPGGSIERIFRTATRLDNTSRPQL